MVRVDGSASDTASMAVWTHGCTMSFGSADVVMFVARVVPVPDGLADLLTSGERVRLAAFARTGDQERFVVAHALLRLAVSDVFGVGRERAQFDFTCSVCGLAHGRPVLLDAGSLPGSPSRFAMSLSTAADRVVVGVARSGEIGVDIERVDDAQFTGFDAVALAENEARALQALPESIARFARATTWVRKEAALKASGHGLRVDPREVPVWEGEVVHTGVTRVAAAPPPVTTTGSGGLTNREADAVVRWSDVELGEAGYVAAVAHTGPEPLRITVRNGDSLLRRS